MKKWLFGQFVAGEHLECLRPVIESQHRSGVRSILDYAVEEDIGNKQEEIKMKPRYGSRGGKGERGEERRGERRGERGGREERGEERERKGRGERRGERGGEMGGRKRWFSAGQATCGPGYLRQEVLNDACNKGMG